MKSFFLFFVSVLGVTPALAERACEIRERSVSYDIEVDWDSDISTKIKSIRIVYGLKRGHFYSDQSMKAYSTAKAVATVKIPDEGLEAAEFAQQQFFNQNAENERCGDRWFCARKAYTGKLGFKSPLQIVSPEGENAGFQIIYGPKGREGKDEFSLSPAEAEKTVDFSLAGMNYGLNPDDIDRNIVDCLAVTLRRRGQRQNLSFIGQCKVSLEIRRIEIGANGTIGDFYSMLGAVALGLKR